MNRLFDRLARKAAHIAGRPLAFACALLLVVIWLIAGPLFHWSDTHSLFINTATTVITYLLLFLVQNSQNRDSMAINAKLDALIKHSKAENVLREIEGKTEAEIQQTKDELNKGK